MVDSNFAYIYNLQIVRSHRPWIDAEFALYQKLLRNQEALLDLELVRINEAIAQARKEIRESNRNNNG